MKKKVKAWCEIFEFNGDKCVGVVSTYGKSGQFFTSYEAKEIADLKIRKENTFYGGYKSKLVRGEVIIDI